jgi:hypothetical protein
MDGLFAGSIKFIHACKVLRATPNTDECVYKKNSTGYPGEPGAEKVPPLVDPSTETSHSPPLFFSSRSLPNPHCWTLSSKVQHSSQRDSCKGLSSDLPKTHSSSSPARSPHRRMSLLHGRRFQSHPTCRGPELRCPTTPLEWTDSLPVQLAAIGQADRWGQVMHPPPVRFPAPAYQGSRLWGKGEGDGEGGGGMVGFLGLPTPSGGLSSNSRRGISHSAQGCMRRPLERFCPAGDPFEWELSYPLVPL